MPSLQTNPAQAEGQPTGRLGRRELAVQSPFATPPPRSPSGSEPMRCDKPLASREITAAKPMPNEVRDLLDGIHFANQLLLSPQWGGSGFRQVCREAGIEPAALDKAAKQRLEQDFSARLHNAQTGVNKPVNLDAAVQLLKQSLENCLQ